MSLPFVLEYLKSLNHKVFTEGLYNLNLIGLRTPKGEVDKFDDWFVVVYRDEAGWIARWWPITTEPGKNALLSPKNPKGTAILAEGQYPGVYSIDLHHGKYEALCQRNGPVSVWRDNDKDGELDEVGTLDTGMFGINIHASANDPYHTDISKETIGPWSEGCQVFKNSADFREMMGIVKRSIQMHPTWTKFTYTLVKAPIP